jgi:peptide/nickel transport system substrate-binding protein
MLKVNQFPTAFLFLFAFVLMIGCKNDTAETTEKPWTRTDNTMEIRLPAPASGLNPILSSGGGYSGQVFRNMFQYLLNIDPKTKEFTSELAKSRPVVAPITSGPYEGGVAYTFELFEEARWDNGDPITGEDYVFSFKVIMTPQLPTQALRGYLYYVRDIQVDPDNPKRFTVLTDEKYILAEEALAAVAPMLPAQVYDPEGVLAQFPISDFLDKEASKKLADNEQLNAFAEQFRSEKFNREKGFVVGSGPYQFEEWVTDQRIVLTKKKDWWGAPLADQYPYLQAYPDTLLFRPIRESATATTLLRDEKLDIGVMLEAEDFLEMKNDPKMSQLYDFYSPSLFRFYFVYINNKNEKLSDPKVRRALAHLTDVNGIIESVFYGLAEPVVGPIHPSKSYYAKDLPLIDFDVNKAKVLLSEAGWTDTDGNGIVDKVINGERVEMRLNYLNTSNETTQRLALLIQSNAKKAGVEIELEQVEFQQLRERLNQRDYELSSGALSSQPILDDLYQIFHTDSDQPGGFNRVSFGNAQSDALIEEINRTLDEERRNSLYYTLQKMIYDEQPMIFILAPQGRLAIHKRFDSFASVVSPGYFPQMYPLKE